MVKIVDGPVKVVIEEERYKELLEKEEWLSALEAAGIDNWEGYGVAQDILEEYK